MEASKKRRGRPRKVAPNHGNDLSARKRSNIHATDCKWTAVSSPYNLKIVLRKIDIRNSALVCCQNEVSPTLTENFKFLSPQLRLPRIDSRIIEQVRNFPFSIIDSHEAGQSFEQILTTYSESVIRSPDMRPVITRSFYAMNTFVENSSCVQQSRKILKDVKNTSNNREIRKNATVQPYLDGQENNPDVSSHNKSVTFPQVCVRLTQLNDQNLHQHDLVEKKYVESSSTVNSIQDRFKSHLQSLNVREINSGKPGNCSSEMTKNFVQTNEIRGPIHLKAAEHPNLEAAPPAKRGRKRKSRERTARENREEPIEKIVCRKNACSSSIVTRQKTAVKNILQTECKTIPTLEISRSTIESQINNDKRTQIIREEVALQFCGTSFDDQENVISDFPKSSSRLQETKFSLNISTVKFHYSPVEVKTIEKSEQQSLSFIGKRKRRKDDSSSESSEYSAPKKRLSVNYNCNKVKPASNGMNKGVIHIEQIQKVQQCPNAIDAFQPPSSGSRTYFFAQPSSSYITRNKASKSKESVDFYQIPWKKVKGIEKLNEEPARSAIKENYHPVKKLNEKLAKSDIKKNCYPVKPKVKRKYVRTKKNSSKNNPVSSYSCYHTRQKTTQNGESTEFYRLPWKKSKGFEIVLDKSKKEVIEAKRFNDEPTFKSWPKKKISVMLPTISVQDAGTSISKKGILKHNDKLASSTPFPESSRRNGNIFFASNIDGTEVDALSPVKSQQKTNTTNHVFNSFPMRLCKVVLPFLPNPLPKSPNKSKRRMTRREARQKAESFNKSKKAFEVEAKSDRSNVNFSLEKSRRGMKRSDRLADQQINDCFSSETSSSSEEEPEILVNRNRQTTPYVRLKKLNSADITSYKITPLKEDRIPKKSKTDEDYGIDDINTDDSTDDEEFPKKCIPQWVKDHKNKPPFQSYMNPDMISDWMKPPQFQYSLRHVFFSIKSHTFM